MSRAGYISLNFLPVQPHEFEMQVYVRKVRVPDQPKTDGTYRYDLPEQEAADKKYVPYDVSFKPLPGFAKRAISNHARVGLTCKYIGFLLNNNCVSKLDPN